MKRQCSKLLFASLLLTLAVLAPGSVARAAPSHPDLPGGCITHVLCTHVATTANTSGNMTVLDEDGGCFTDLRDFLFVTANLTPTNGGYTGPSDPHPVGVLFDSATQRWAIFNEDGAPMPVGAAFNVVAYCYWLIDQPTIQQATAANTSGPMTTISAPNYDGEPNDVLMVTPRLDSQNILDPHPLGVTYNPVTGHWVILHEDGTPIPLGALYNIRPQLTTAAYRHTATAANSGGNATVLDNTYLNNHPELQVFVLPYHPMICTPSRGGQFCFLYGSFDPSPLGVLYNFLLSQWQIVNLDGTALQANTTFNVWI